MAVDHLPAAVPEHRHLPGAQDGVEQRRAHGKKAHHVDGSIVEHRVHWGKATRFGVFLGKRAHHARAGQVFLHHHVHVRPGFLHHLKKRPDALGKAKRDCNQHGNNQEREQGELPVGEEQHDGHAAGNQDNLDDLKDAHGREATDAFHVAGGSRHQLASAGPVVKAERKALDVHVQLISDGKDHPLTQDFGHELAAELRKALECREGNHQTCRDKENRPGAFLKPLVNGLAQNHWNRQVSDRTDEGDGQGAQAQSPMWQGIANQAGQDCGATHGCPFVAT